MNITFAGVGNAFTDALHYQSNAFVTSDSGKRLLLDCGGDARFSLGEFGVTNANVGSWLDGVFISHIHADHVGGLEWLAFCTYFNPTVPRPKLYIAEELVSPLWDTLKHGFDCITGVDVDLNSFFEVLPFKTGFLWEGIEFRAVKGQHVFSNKTPIPVYGLRFGNVYYSADTVITENTTKACEESDLVFHDCETNARLSGVHAHYTQLVDLPNELKKKMWLYHYSPNPQYDFVKDGFLGFVKKGQSFEYLV